MTEPPTISIIVPVHNGHDCLPRCLESIGRSPKPPFELLVVDDMSTDDSIQIAEEAGATVLSTGVNSGPSKARNLGAEAARGEVVYFLDADVEMHPGNLKRIAEMFANTDDLVAVFGSYDAEPDAKTFVSQYKNLVHHFVHQHGNREASTFWSGCGAIRRDVFLELNGFDDTRFKMPAVEDIELGYRVRAGGHRILLDPDLQVKHLKRWTFVSMLKADIFGRAIPWSFLMLDQGSLDNDLNLRYSQRISAVAACLIPLLLILSFFDGRVVWLAAILLLLILILNRALFLFFLRHRGLLFMPGVILMQLLYYFYSTVTFAGCFLIHRLRARPRSSTA